MSDANTQIDLLHKQIAASQQQSALAIKAGQIAAWQVEKDREQRLRADVQAVELTRGYS